MEIATLPLATQFTYPCRRKTNGYYNDLRGCLRSRKALETRPIAIKQIQLDSVKRAMSQSYPTYPSNLTEEQWELLRHLLPAAKAGVRPRTVDLKAVVNAIVYILCAGGAWRILPHDFPCCNQVT